MDKFDGGKLGKFGKLSVIHQTKKPFKFVFTINNLLDDLLIRQTFSPNAQRKPNCQTPAKLSHYTTLIIMAHITHTTSIYFTQFVYFNLHKYILYSGLFSKWKFFIK